MRTVVITGSRDFNDPFFANLNIRASVMALAAEGYTTLVHGDARGADRMAAAAAKEAGMEVVAVPANWDVHGKRAGIIRNVAMLDEWMPSVVVAYWNGESRGTRHMIETAYARRIPVSVWKM